MDKICAVVDAQGFYIKNQFFPREVAFTSESLSHCQEFNPNINWFSITQNEKHLIKHLRDKIHGFTLNTFKSKEPIIPLSESYIEYLKSFYNIFATEEKPYFGVKNLHVKDDLIKAGIPVIDLSNPELEFPNITSIERYYNNNTWICAYHTEDTQGYKKFRCALRKCHNLWMYLNDKGIKRLENEAIRA
jgi:hypothetical protein